MVTSYRCVLLGAVMFAGCDSGSDVVASPQEAAPAEREWAAEPAAAEPAEGAAAEALAAAVAAAGPRVRFVPAEAGEPGELPGQVQAFMAEARADGRTPLVYVGAGWCEPCRYFHQAAERGELDDRLPRLALLEFDLDVDAARLEAAGCRSRMIPLFAVPDAAGRCTDQRIEGSIHGPGSPAQILPRLLEILRPRP
ncbi:MAG: hypothetical protein CMN30_33630 [Sandaracinus sp.]|nr:hypothetical protein [Sandaracinus sp.]